MSYRYRLLQSLDCPRFDAENYESRLIQARTEIMFSLLFGEVIALAPTHFAESPAFFGLLTEILCAFETHHTRRKLGNWSPIKLWFEWPGELHAYQQDALLAFLENWWSRNDLHTMLFADTRGLPLGNHSSRERKDALNILTAKQFGALDDVVGRNNIGRQIELINSHINNGFIKVAAIPRIDINYFNVLKLVSGSIKINEVNIDPIERIRSALNKNASHLQGALTRSKWYNDGPDIFENDWDLVKVWIDEAYNSSRFFRYDDVTSATFSTEEMAIDNYQKYESCFDMKPCEEYESTIIGNFNWSNFFDILSDDDCRNNIDKLNYAISESNYHKAQEVFEKHSRYIAQHLGNVTCRESQFGTIWTGRIDKVKKAHDIASPIMKAIDTMANPLGGLTLFGSLALPNPLPGITIAGGVLVAGKAIADAARYAHKKYYIPRAVKRKTSEISSYVSTHFVYRRPQ